MSLKLHGLRLAYSAFCSQDQTAFEQFIAQNGEALKIQGTMHYIVGSLHNLANNGAGISGQNNITITIHQQWHNSKQNKAI